MTEEIPDFSEDIEIKPTTGKKTEPDELKKYREALEKLAPEAVENRKFVPLKGKIPDVPRGESWKDHLIDWNEALRRLKNGKNNGEVFKGDLVGEDIDQVEKAQELFEEKERPDAIQGVSRNGDPHHRWINGGVTGNPEVSDDDDETIVEYKTDWKYLVAPGSYAEPDSDAKGDGVYKIVAIPEKLGTLKPEHLPKKLRKDRCSGEGAEFDVRSDFSYQDIIPEENWKKLRDHRNRLQGPHPEHGSSTRRNFVIWKDNQTWTCFRHNTGGNVWSFLAVVEGIIDCSEAKAGALKEKKKWKKTIRAAYDRDLIDSYLAKTLTKQANQFAQTRKSKKNHKTEIDADLKEKIEKYAFDKKKKPSWNCKTKFVAFLSGIEFDDKEIEFKDCYELPEDLADRLIDENIAVRYAWQCGKCLRIYRQRSKPNYCRDEECDGKKKHMESIHPTEGYQMGDTLLDNYYWATPIESRGESRTGLVHLYKNGIYHNDLSKGFVRTKTRMMNHVTRQSVQKHAMDLVGDLRSIPEKAFGLSGSRVVIRDGILDLSELEIKPHDPEALALSKIDVEFDPEAECPKFLEFLEEVIPDREDRKRLQEVLGTALVNEKPHKKGVILVGPTDAGKSTLIVIIRGVFGKENTESQSPYALSETRWGRARLRNVKLNMTDEVNETRLKNLNVLKRIMDGNPIDAEFKGEKKFEMYPTTEHLYAANQTPTADRKDDAFWNRWIPIEMPKSVPEDFPDKEEADPDLADKIVEEEKEGIFKWIVQGFRDFMENGKKFTHSVDWKKARDTWLNWGSAIQRFIQNHIEKDLDNKVTTREIYEQVVDYADENDLDAPSSQKAVTSEVKKLPYASYSENYVIDDKRQRGFEGIKLTYNTDNTENSTLTQDREKNKDDSQRKIKKSNNRCEKNRVFRVMDEVKRKLQHEGMGYTPEELMEEMDLESEEFAKTVLEELYEKGTVEKTEDEATGKPVYRAVQGRVEDLGED